MTKIHDTNISLGKYLVSPLIRMTEAGAYLASVSVRSGRGSGTHDRVFRFADIFPTRESARRYAVEQGLRFVLPRLPASGPFQPSPQGTL
ncbi:hypothetical protein [Pseudorhodoferax sp. Leaf267]|uniref:hypothetical protein n=1 Tax=Pseudorhodoferax sp. Leaf267 TaxID=1736316 RepID=UPI0006F2B8FB|nr:hypothetical protein [Pseudorhodoferax sp. Leaf267]KQP12715.1 hypothetical protein ASF43_21060 [Pseudorhodoferax sp. Leaf267]